MEASNTVPAPAAPKPRNQYVSLSDFLKKSSIALSNASLPDILPLLAKRGYTDAIISSKLTELNTLQTLMENQKKEYGEQYDATQAYKKAEEVLHNDYMDHVILARMVFKGSYTAQAALGTNGKRNASTSSYIIQALQFYNAALSNPEYVTALGTKGIEEKELEAMKAGYENLLPLAAAQTKESGEAQAATKARDAAYESLHEWMSEFKETAIIALRKHPQLREQLGYKEE
jgi:hypothetical protein